WTSARSPTCAERTPHRPPGAQTEDMILDQFNLQGKTALITGATHGLGMAMAKALGQAGATIVINGHSSRERIEAALAEYRGEGLQPRGYLFNVTDEGAVQA